MKCCTFGNKPAYKSIDENLDTTKLVPILTEYRHIKGSLITILQKTQDIYGYLPGEVLNYIAYETGFSPAKVWGVATFYTQFRLAPVGKYLIMLCQGTACYVNGSAIIGEAIIDELRLSGGQLTTADGLFTLNNVACLGCCSLSPVMMINGDTHGLLTPAGARRIIRNLIKKEAQIALPTKI